MSEDRTPRRARWPESSSRPLVSPLQPSVVYTSADPDALDAQYDGSAPGYTYAREGHPNADVLAGMIDRMEGAEGGLVTGSGMAAVVAAFLANLRAGDHIVAADRLYGRSQRIIAEDLPRFGIGVTQADTTDAGAVAAAMRPETRMIHAETLSNPDLRVADLEGIAALAAARGVLLSVDNTFATPQGVRAFEAGADIVIHSVTKLLAGHSDVTLGYVAARDPAIVERMRVLAVTMGLTPSPFDCWLAERGLLSFGMRWERAQATAAALADMLAARDEVVRVLYPGRADHPDAARAARLMGGQGGNMVAFEIAGGRDSANRLVRGAAGIAFAPTLGDVATTMSHPASSSHRALTPGARAALGLSEGFFRVSVGCEPAGEVLARFGTALDGLG